jgi:hypothetical protein
VPSSKVIGGLGETDGGGDGEADGGGDGDVDGGGEGEADGGGEGETDGGGGGDGHASIGSGTVVQVKKPEVWHSSKQASSIGPSAFQTQKVISSPAFCHVLRHRASDFPASSLTRVQRSLSSARSRPSAASWASM